MSAQPAFLAQTPLTTLDWASQAGCCLRATRTMTSIPTQPSAPARSKLVTQEKIDRKIKSGCGKGIRECYKPWIKVWDIRSRGVSNLVAGLKFNRTHHLLSNAERDYLLILEQDPSIIDIREQYPLFTQGETQAIASSLNIRHPVYPGTKVPVVMTTDFLITFIDSRGEEKLAARSVKYRSEFDGGSIEAKNRIVEKLSIEQRYWQNREVEWSLVLHENLPSNKIANLKILRTYASIHPSLPTSKNVSNLLSFISSAKTDQVPLKVLLERASKTMFMNYIDVKRLFHHLIWGGQLEINISSMVIDLSKPLHVWIGRSSSVEKLLPEVRRHA